MVNVFDENYPLGQLSRRSKFAAASDKQWESNNGIRLQTFTDGFYPQQFRHKTGWHRDGNGHLATIPGFGDEYGENNKYKDDLVFLGDENSDPTHIGNVSDFATLYANFFDKVKEKSDGRGKTAMGSEVGSGRVWFTDVLNELHSRRPNVKWVDEWIFQLYMGDPVTDSGAVDSDVVDRWKQNVESCARWSDEHNAKMFLAFTINGNTYSEEIADVLRDIMNFINQDQRIAEAAWWHFQAGQTMRPLTTPVGSDRFSLEPIGHEFKRISDSLALLSIV